MIFRQFFDNISFTYTYLLGSKSTRKALIIDPVLENVDRYIRLLKELGLKLEKAVDTHVHADHITGLGELRDRTNCITVMGKKSKLDVVSMRVDDGDHIEIEGLTLEVMYTPGHTDDSYCYLLDDRVFTGDTLLIRGTGRTDFQNGDSIAAYDSLFGKLLTLPDETLIYPGHDYKGDTVSTIGEEKAFNPRLQVKSAAEYARIMDNLNLDHPKLMDVAVPANLSVGFVQQDAEIKGRTYSVDQAILKLGQQETLFIDLREDTERERDGIIPGSVHVPYNRLDEYIKPSSPLQIMAKETGKDLLLYCTYGERSALALRVLLDAGFRNVHHLGGGMEEWSKMDGAVELPESNA